MNAVSSIMSAAKSAMVGLRLRSNKNRYMYVCMYVCMYLSLSLYIYIYIYMYTFAYKI